MAQIYGHLKEVGSSREFHPLACTKMPDGTYVLKVDTEISLDGTTLNIDNIRIASVDQTALNAKYIKVKTDGTVYVEAVISRGNPVIYTGNALIIASTISFSSSAKHIQVENMDTTNNIYISFDSGATWRTIQPGYTLDIDCDAVASLDIKADVDTTPYEIMTSE